MRPPAILFPVSLLLNGWAAYLFLSILMAILMIFNSVFYANITIATNRTVEAQYRATLNGLSSVGASIGRGCGPLFAGSLVAFCLSSGYIVSTEYGSICIYTILTALGMIAFAATPFPCRPTKSWRWKRRAMGLRLKGRMWSQKKIRYNDVKSTALLPEEE